MIFWLCWAILCLKLAISSAFKLKRLQPIMRQEAPFWFSRARWHDLMRSWKVFTSSVSSSAAISRAPWSSPVGGATAMAWPKIYRASSKERRRDQALLVVWGDHAVAESLVDRLGMNDIGSSNDLAEWGWGRWDEKKSCNIGHTRALNVKEVWGLRRILPTVFPQNFVRLSCWSLISFANDCWWQLGAVFFPSISDASTVPSLFLFSRTVKKCWEYACNRIPLIWQIRIMLGHGIHRHW